MTTKLQDLGNLGENLVRKTINCPKCKRHTKSLRVLPINFRCADLICDFCGYLSQVKTKSVADIETCPTTIIGAAWAPQKERMEAGIYFPLFIVLNNAKKKQNSIYYLPADMQTFSMFQPRVPLQSSAKRAGWQGFTINIADATAKPIRLR